MQIKSIKIKNYKALQDIHMDKIPEFSVLVGANGTGKSTFIDVFEFLKDCLKDNARSALQRRGGFLQVVSRNHDGEPIEIELQIDMNLSAIQTPRLVTYTLKIIEENKRVSIAEESLRFKRGRYGAPYHFLKFEDGRGEALAESFDAFDETVPYEELKREKQDLNSPFILALKGLGQFQRFDAASQLRELIENWTVSDFRIDDARIEPDAAVAEHLNETGDNIALYAQYLFEEHPSSFSEIEQKMKRFVPGISSIATEDTGDGRIALRFKDQAFDRGFIARAVSDGTIKMFAYLALLHDPNPHPLLCVEEPENQLYPTLLTNLAEQFAEYAHRRKGGGQVFVTTHSPDFLNHVPLESIYWLTKRDGFSHIGRASDDEQLNALVAEGDLPGWLWREGMFPGVHPA